MRAGFAKVEKRVRTTAGGASGSVRNLRIREDTAKYLLNLDPDSAHYDPKSRSMREDPQARAPGKKPLEPKPSQWCTPHAANFANAGSRGCPLLVYQEGLGDGLEYWAVRVALAAGPLASLAVHVHHFCSSMHASLMRGNSSSCASACNAPQLGCHDRWFVFS
jgi:hypothetical protein